MAKPRIAVLFGGASKDHFVSLRSASNVLNTLAHNALAQAEIEVIPIGITKNGRWLYFPGSYDEVADGTWEFNSDCVSAILSPDPNHKGIVKIMGDGSTSLLKIDAVLSVLHGKYGECGRIQGLCKLGGIPIIGSPLEAASIAIDKVLTHLVLNAAGLLTTKFVYLERSNMAISDTDISNALDNLPFPVYVKPASCSSSIGANLVQNKDELKAALKIAFSHDHRAILEEKITGRDIECIVYNSSGTAKASVLGELTPNDCGDNNAFIVATLSLNVPANIPEDFTKKIQHIAIEAFNALGCKGYARVDLTLMENDIYVRKVCVMPGFSTANVLPILMKASGFSNGKFLEMLIEHEIG